jgi:hypothetical protein
VSLTRRTSSPPARTTSRLSQRRALEAPGLGASNKRRPPSNVNFPTVRRRLGDHVTHLERLERPLAARGISPPRPSPPHTVTLAPCGAPRHRIRSAGARRPSATRRGSLPTDAAAAGDASPVGRSGPPYVNGARTLGRPPSPRSRCQDHATHLPSPGRRGGANQTSGHNSRWPAGRARPVLPPPSLRPSPTKPVQVGLMKSQMASSDGQVSN